MISRSRTSALTKSTDPRFICSPILAKLPVDRLSTTSTAYPAVTSPSTTWLPTKPAPPVTNTLLMFLLFTARNQRGMILRHASRLTCMYCLAPKTLSSQYNLEQSVQSYETLEPPVSVNERKPQHVTYSNGSRYAREGNSDDAYDEKS